VALGDAPDQSENKYECLCCAKPGSTKQAHPKSEGKARKVYEMEEMARETSRLWVGLQLKNVKDVSLEE